MVIGDRVWLDANGNGLQDSAEVGIANVVIGLFTPNMATALRTTATDASGLYQFSSVSPTVSVIVVVVVVLLNHLFLNPSLPSLQGRLQLEQNRQYTLKVVLNQESISTYRLTDTDVNGNTQNAVDNDFREDPVDMSLLTAAVLTPAFGQQDLTFDLGLKPSLEIGDRVWDDQNGNGLQDPGEPGIPNVPVQLYCNGVLRAEVNTASDGMFSFSRTVEPNRDCNVCVPLTSAPLNGLEPALAEQGTDRAIDSNGIREAQRVCGPVRTGDFGWKDLTIDFGFTRGLSLGDFVWSDIDGEGDQDTNEPGIANVIVELYRRGDDFTNPNVQPVSSATTDSTGKYFFTSSNNNVLPNQLYNIVIR